MGAGRGPVADFVFRFVVSHSFVRVRHTLLLVHPLHSDISHTVTRTDEVV